MVRHGGLLEKLPRRLASSDTPVRRYVELGYTSIIKDLAALITFHKWY